MGCELYLCVMLALLLGSVAFLVHTLPLPLIKGYGWGWVPPKFIFLAACWGIFIAVEALVTTLHRQLALLSRRLSLPSRRHSGRDRTAIAGIIVVERNDSRRSAPADKLGGKTYEAWHSCKWPCGFDTTLGRRDHHLVRVSLTCSRADTTWLHERTFSVARARDITFGISPHGDAIVFNAVGVGGLDLYILDLKTRRVTRIAATRLRDRSRVLRRRQVDCLFRW